MVIQQRAFKYRIYPSGKQKVRIINQFKICKEIYNTLLGLNKTLWTTSKPDFDSLVKDIKTTCPEYYYQAYSQVLQNVSDRLSKAFDNFFNRIKFRKKGIRIKSGYPRFKSRIQSITYPQDNGSAFKFVSSTRLHISKIGSLPIILHRVPKGKIKTLTIKQNKANQWFACFSCEIDVPNITNSSPNHIGLDVGLTDYLWSNEKEIVDNPRFLIHAEKRLKRLYRRLSRTKKGSNNRNKQRIKLSRQHLKVANQRDNFVHKLSKRIVKSFSFIAVENLNIKNMLRNHHLAKHISDASWGKFFQYLEYKAIISGSRFVRINPSGTTNRCFQCGTRVEMPLSKRHFHCPECGLDLHRELKSAKHILLKGYDTAGLAGISTPVETSPLPALSGKASEVMESGTIYGSS